MNGRTTLIVASEWCFFWQLENCLLINNYSNWTEKSIIQGASASTRQASARPIWNYKKINRNGKQKHALIYNDFFGKIQDWNRFCKRFCYCSNSYQSTPVVVMLLQLLVHDLQQHLHNKNKNLFDRRILKNGCNTKRVAASGDGLQKTKTQTMRNKILQTLQKYLPAMTKTCLQEDNFESVAVHVSTIMF